MLHMYIHIYAAVIYASTACIYVATQLGSKAMPLAINFSIFSELYLCQDDLSIVSGSVSSTSGETPRRLVFLSVWLCHVPMSVCVCVGVCLCIIIVDT